MMFRNTADMGEESGSDWDDYSPQHPSPVGVARKQTTPTGGRRPEVNMPGLEVEEQSHTPSLPHSSPKRTARKPATHTQTESGEPHFISLGSAQEPLAPPTPATPTGRTYRVTHDEVTQPLTPAHTPSHTSPPPPSHSVLGESLGGKSARQQLQSIDGVFRFHTVSEGAARKLLTEREPQQATMAALASRSEALSQRCAGELFSCFRVVTDFIIAFFLECLHYVLAHLLRKVFCGLLVVVSDALCKPTMVDLFNAVWWPLCACLWQASRAVGLCLGPCFEVLGAGVSHCATLVRAFRLVEVQMNKTVQQV